jgi:hypothetical protein
MSDKSTNTKLCNACGRLITRPKWYSPNCFRLRVNSIENLDQLIESKEYFSRCIESRYNKNLSYSFLETLEKMIKYHDDQSSDIEYIKIWLLKIVNTSLDKETQFYAFLKDNYAEINVSFATLYNNYIHSVDDDHPLNKNQVSRALSVLGLKMVMVKEKHNNKWKSIVMVRASEDRLSEIFRKNDI